MPLRTFASKYFPETEPMHVLEQTKLLEKNSHPKVLLKKIDYVEAKAKASVKKFMGLKESTPELVKALHDLHLEGKYEKDGVPFHPPEPKNFYESARAYVHFLPLRVVESPKTSPKNSASSTRHNSLDNNSTGGQTTAKRSVQWREQLVDVREFTQDD